MITNKMHKLKSCPAVKLLQNHFQQMIPFQLNHAFKTDANRFAHFSLQSDNILLDYSKNLITNDTMRLLKQLADEMQLSEKISALFRGDSINFTENRPAWHTALRDQKQLEVTTALLHIQEFTQKVREGQWLGATGKPIRDIINIGIGGSHLGPLMTTHALMEQASPSLHCHFISNVDGAHLYEVLQKIDPERALFIISSKSFTTIETLSNAKIIRSWLQKKLGTETISSHFVAITAKPDRAIQFGIAETQIFTFWDWVGGRYSIWSSIGLPLALMIGMDNFYEFLRGAQAMDQHFRQTEFSQNMPVILALLGIWYINFFGASAQAIVPYSHYLHYFPDYIQQLDMESNGKQTTQFGELTEHMTGPVIFGKQGCDAQHSFFQLLHQSQKFIPIDFILVGESHHFSENQDLLVASGLSQSQALMQGKITADLHKSIPGNRPNTVLFLDKITPFILGQLIALYEHKIFVQGVIWNINSFDQWGVELGKQLLPTILAELQSDISNITGDASTAGIISYYKKLNKRTKRDA